MIKVNPYVLGMMSTNCYILYDDAETPDQEGFRQAVVIDAAAEPERLIDICEKDLKVKPVAILLTHGHFDHIMAVDALRERYGIKAYGLDAEKEVFVTPEYNLSARFETAFRLEGVELLSDGSVYRHKGKVETVEGDFERGTGSIAFRVRFPNPEGLLKHGVTGKIRMLTRMDDVYLVPQKSTFEIQDFTYVYVVDEKNVAKVRSFQPLERYHQFYVT